MKVREIMTDDVISVDKDIDLKHVLDLMKKNDITKIPVLEDKKLIGIATDNVIAFKLGSIRKKWVPASRLHASSVTEKNITTISPNTDVKDILKLVGKPGPTMLPVVKNNKLVGVVTKADLLPLVSDTKSINSIVEKNVYTVSSNDRIIHARRIIIDNNVARLPVVDQGKLVGIISDFEIALSLAKLKRSFSLGRQKRKLDELLVKDAMKPKVIWTVPSVSVTEASKLMMKYNVGALPILEDESLVGIVSRTTLLNTISI
jgi:CBS domain-containing protein